MPPRPGAGPVAGMVATLLAVLAPCPGLASEPGGEIVPTAILSDAGPQARLIEERILLDRRLRPAPLERARLVWVLGAAVGSRTWHQILSRVREGAGLVFVPGARLPDLSLLGLTPGRGPLAGRVSLQALQGATPAPALKNAVRVLTGEVNWPSAPQADLRWPLSRGSGGSLTPLVQSQQTGEPVLLVGTLGRGRVAVFSLRLTDSSNRELVLWPYFNYLVFALSMHLAGQQPEPFARWPHAPVPGQSALFLLLSLMAVLWVVTVGLFFRARRHSRRHPEILKRFFVPAPAAPAGASSPPAQRQTGAAWSSIGFSRPLAGFLTLTAVLFLLFAPFYYVTNILIPNDIQPFPQSKGIWDFAWEALQIAWFLFDAGTFVAFVKYFAEYRIKDPSEAVRSAQFYVWWQILTGLVQVTAASLVAVLVLPHTRYGYTSNFVILIALSQYPGCFGVLTLFFQAYQRFDYNIGLDLLSDWLLRFALQIPCVLLFRAWGVAHPEYGEALGAALGIGVGFFLSTVVTFVIGVVLYRRLGLHLLPLFLAHFNLATGLRMLRYGLKVVTGQAFFRAAKTIDRVVISLLLINYTEWLGIEGQIHYHLMFLFPVAYRFFETAMAALSESHGNNKPALTQYYLVRFFQVGSLYTAIALSLMVALGPSFVRHVMDPQWARAADYLVLAGVVGALYAPAWLSDMLQKGAGRPGLFAWVLGIEQVLRIGLFWLLIPSLQFRGFYLAILITIALKVVGGWVVNHLVIVRLRIFIWQMFFAPALAGVGNFLILRGLAAGLALSGPLQVTLLFFGAALLSFFICFFCCGLAGGFDAAMTGELQQASRMTGPLRPLTRLFYLAARAGWALSPLQGRFPVTLHERAMAEARELETQHL